MVRGTVRSLNGGLDSQLFQRLPILSSDKADRGVEVQIWVYVEHIVRAEKRGVVEAVRAWMFSGSQNPLSPGTDKCRRDESTRDIFEEGGVPNQSVVVHMLEPGLQMCRVYQQLSKAAICCSAYLFSFYHLAHPTLVLPRYLNGCLTDGTVLGAFGQCFPRRK